MENFRHQSRAYGDARDEKSRSRVWSGKKSGRGDFGAPGDAIGKMSHRQDINSCDQKYLCKRFLAGHHGRDSTDDIARIAYSGCGRAIIAVGHHLFHGTIRHAHSRHRHCRSRAGHMRHAHNRGRKQTQRHEDVKQLLHRRKVSRSDWRVHDLDHIKLWQSHDHCQNPRASGQTRNPKMKDHIRP